MDLNNGSLIDTIDLKGEFINPGIITKNSLFLVSSIIKESEPQSILYKIDLTQNKIVWQKSVIVTYSYIVSDNFVVLGGYEKIEVIDLENKLTKWNLNDQVDDTSGSFKNIIVLNNYIVTGRSDGYIYFIALSNGKILRKQRIGTFWQKFLDFTPSITHMIPGRGGVISFLSNGDMVYIH